MFSILSKVASSAYNMLGDSTKSWINSEVKSAANYAVDYMLPAGKNLERSGVSGEITMQKK